MMKENIDSRHLSIYETDISYNRRRQMGQRNKAPLKLSYMVGSYFSRHGKQMNQALSS